MYFQAIFLVYSNPFKQFRNNVESFYHTDNKPQILRLIIHQSPISSPSIEVSTDSLESEKVWRLCRFGQNLPPSERIQPENLFPFTSVQ